MKRVFLIVCLALIAASAYSVDVWIKGWFSDNYIEDALIGPLHASLRGQRVLEPAESEGSADVLLIISGIANYNMADDLIGFSFAVSVVPVGMPRATGNAVYSVEPSERGFTLVGQWIVDYLVFVVTNSIGSGQGGSL